MKECQLFCIRCSDIPEAGHWDIRKADNFSFWLFIFGKIMLECIWFVFYRYINEKAEGGRISVWRYPWGRRDKNGGTGDLLNIRYSQSEVM